MKKCILSALAGAATMFLLLALIANTRNAQGTEEYEHIDYVSAITEAECFICGDTGDTIASAYWGEDNVGLINLNNFDLLHLPINRYPCWNPLCCRVATRVFALAVAHFCFHRF